MKSKLGQALWYGEKGFSVIPVRPDKKPFIKWTEYQAKKASPDQISTWWTKWPDANVGIVTGKTSGIMVVDVDSQAGHDALNEFLPDNIQTPAVKTPSGGWHYYFKYQNGLVNRARVITDCDVRTDGGYIVAPASVGENGNSYSWLPGLGLHEVDPAGMPEMLFSILQSGGAPLSAPHASSYIIDSIHSSKKGVRSPVVTDHKRPQMTTSDHSFLSKGGRDEALFHLANHLVKGGMPSANIYKYMSFFGANCNPPFPEKEIQAKIQSALNRTESQERSLSQEIREWVVTTTGHILTTDVHRELQLTTRREKKTTAMVLKRMSEEENPIIEKTGKRNGEYRRLDGECDAMDFLNCETETTDIWLPFNLHRKVETMPGNIIVIAGEPNAGKTGMLLNVIRNNMHKAEVHYFNSEMGGSELKKRLKLFPDILPSQWNFKAWERSDNFSDVIKPGKGKINIIDFLEIHDEFYKVGGQLAEIHKKLKGAIAVVALQKNMGTDFGLGGGRGLEKPRLYLAMAPHALKIVKAKNWKTDQNPNGQQIDFKVVSGCQFIKQRDWYRPEKK